MPKRITQFLYIGAVGKGEIIVIILKHNTQREKTHGKTVILSRYVYIYVLIFLVTTISNVCREGVRFSKKLY